jgi:hypothetical protein
MSDSALAHLGIASAWMRSRGLPFYELVPPKVTSEHAVGLAVRWPNEDFTVLSVPFADDEAAHLTTGVLRDVKHNDKLALLEVCNDLTGGFAPSACTLHEREDLGWCVLRQVRFPVALVDSAPQYFASLLQDMSTAGAQARDALEARGLTGNRFPWDAGHLLGLLDHSAG